LEHIPLEITSNRPKKLKLFFEEYKIGSAPKRPDAPLKWQFGRKTAVPRLPWILFYCTVGEYGLWVSISYMQV